MKVSTWLAAFLVGSLVACQTTSTDTDTTEAKTPPPQFVPAEPLSGIHARAGRYPNLYAPESYAVWIDEEVAAIKREQDAEDGVVVEPVIEETAEAVIPEFAVVECHMVSAFPDASIGYDAVAFRGMQVYIETPEGRRIDPLQTVIGRVEEEQQEALRRFTRTNLVVFPRRDPWDGTPLISAHTENLILVVENVNGGFYFDWQAADPLPRGWQASAVERLRIARTGFREVFSKLDALTHYFD